MSNSNILEVRYFFEETKTSKTLKFDSQAISWDRRGANPKCNKYGSNAKFEKRINVYHWREWLAQFLYEIPIVDCFGTVERHFDFDEMVWKSRGYPIPEDSWFQIESFYLNYPVMNDRVAYVRGKVLMVDQTR